jgi:hypothetical protein
MQNTPTLVQTHTEIPIFRVFYAVKKQVSYIGLIQLRDKDSDGRPDYICQNCGYPKACCACSLQTKKTEQKK